MLMTITPGVKVITRQMTPFFSYTLSPINWYISFLHFKAFKIQFLRVPTLHYVVFYKIHVSITKMIL